MVRAASLCVLDGLNRSRLSWRTWGANRDQITRLIESTMKGTMNQPTVDGPRGQSSAATEEITKAVSLRELATTYGSDKLFAHSYIDSFYAQVFERMSVRRLLELGIGFADLMRPLVPHYVHGGSLLMWADFFPAAQIYACDIRPETLINNGRIQSLQCDQYDAAALRAVAQSFGGHFDVVIDDGCHHTMAQIISFMVLWPHIVPGGLYVIEDVGYPEVLAKAIEGEMHIFRKDGRWDDVLVTKRKPA